MIHIDVHTYKHKTLSYLPLIVIDGILGVFLSIPFTQFYLNIESVSDYIQSIPFSYNDITSFLMSILSPFLAVLILAPFLIILLDEFVNRYKAVTFFSLCLAAGILFEILAAGFAGGIMGIGMSFISLVDGEIATLELLSIFATPVFMFYAGLLVLLIELPKAVLAGVSFGLFNTLWVYVKHRIRSNGT